MGAAAAAVIIKRERDLVEHFQRAGAVSPETAKTRDEIGVDEQMTWFRLVDDAVIRSSAEGRFYVDLPTWEAQGRRRRRVITMALVIAVLAVAFTVYSTTMARQ